MHTQNHAFSDKMGERARQWFDDFFEEYIKPQVQGRAVDVVGEIRETLDCERDAAINEEGLFHDRDHWEIFGGEYPLKSSASVLSKLVRDGVAKTGGTLLEMQQDGLVAEVFKLPDLA